MLKVCLDLNVWIGAFLSERLGHAETATQSLVSAVRSGSSARGPVGLVISWGMLNRLREVLLRQEFDELLVQRLIEVIATYAREGPSLTLGGVGVLPLDDNEDRHVLETALAGGANLLVTQNLADFVGDDVRTLVEGRLYGVRHGRAMLLIVHTYTAAAWLKDGALPPEALAYLP